MAEQICKDCEGLGEWECYGKAYFCKTCDGAGEINRTGPYRLADGTWSDGVDRSVSIRRQPIRDRIKVSLSPWSGEWQVHNKLPRSTGVFNTWEKAIAYADRMARTNQGENND